MSSSPYKRRRPSIVRNFWIYRRVVALAAVLGLMLWFVWVNHAPVTVAFPFGMGTFTSTTGQVILLSAMVGSVATALTMTLFLAWRRVRSPRQGTADDEHTKFPDDKPPADYAAKASELPTERDWT